MGLNITDPTKVYYTNNTYHNYALDNVSANKELRYLQIISEKTKTYSEIIRNAYQTSSNLFQYPDNSLAHQLQIVARLIHGGLKTRVYCVSLGSFDTHKQQVN